MDYNIRQIAAFYQETASRHSTVKGRIRDLYRRYVKEREDSILELVATATLVGKVAMSTDSATITPQMVEAFALAFPNLDLDTVVSTYSAEQLQGIAAAWKGKYFEVLVRDRLNEGLPVGEVQLDHGQTAVLADSPTQAGWDLLILNSDGSVAETMQLKATESLSYVSEALVKYPDITVLATDEAADQVPGILSAGITDAQLEADISGVLDPTDTEWVDFTDVVLPGLPFIIILASEGHRVITGRSTLETALPRAFERSLKTGAALGVGLGLAALDMGILSIPGALLTRIGLDRTSLFRKVGQRLEVRRKLIADISSAEYPLLT